MQGNINPQEKKEYDRQEIKQIINNYIYAIHTQSPSNQLKLMVYNRIDRGRYIGEELVYKQKQRSVDNREDIFVDSNLWNQAKQKNPNDKIYYPFQLNCPKHLLARTNITNSMQHYAFEYIIDYQKLMNDSKRLFDVEIQESYAVCKKKLDKIKNKQIAVISKLERMAINLNKAEKDLNLESNLIQKFNAIKNFFVENSDFVNNFNEISSKTFLFKDRKNDYDKIPLNKEKNPKVNALF